MLADTCHPVPRQFALVVERRRVERGSVCPDGDVVLAPLEPDVEVVVVGHEPVQVVEDLLALVRRELVDTLGEGPVDEDALPACDWAGPDDGVRGLECCAVVVGVTAGADAGGVPELLSDGEKELGFVRGGEALGEVLVW